MVFVTLSKIIQSVRPSMLMVIVSPPSSSSIGSGISKVKVSPDSLKEDEVNSKEAVSGALSEKYG